MVRLTIIGIGVALALFFLGGSAIWYVLGFGDHLQIDGAAQKVTDAPAGAGEGWSMRGLCAAVLAGMALVGSCMAVISACLFVISSSFAVTAVWLSTTACCIPAVWLAARVWACWASALLLAVAVFSPSASLSRAVLAA